MDDVYIIIRPFDLERDQAMIYSSWRNSAYYSALIKPEISPTKFFKDKSKEISQILPKASIKIACYQDSPEVIVGYSVTIGTHLEWIYVKGDFRKKGIGTLLMPKNIETVTSSLTKIGKVLTEKKKLKIQGEKDGNTRRKEDREEKISTIHSTGF